MQIGAQAQEEIVRLSQYAAGRFVSQSLPTSWFVLSEPSLK